MYIPFSACAPNEFQCSNGRCIPFEKQCDGYADCDQNEDEEGCDKPCSSHELRCANGDCIPLHKQCDGFKDCLDGSDEICRKLKFSFIVLYRALYWFSLML